MNLTDKQIIAHLATENYRLERENETLKAKLDRSIPVQMISAGEFIEMMGGKKL